MQNSFRQASCCSILLSLYQCKLICKIAAWKPLKQSELFHFSPQEESDKVLIDIRTQWEREKKLKSPSLIRAVNRLLICPYVLLSLIGIFVWSVPAIEFFVLGRFLTETQKQHSSRSLLILAGILGALRILNLLLRNVFDLYRRLLGQKLHKSLVSLHYSKLMKLTISSLSQDVKQSALNQDLKVLLQVYPQIPFLIVSPVATIVSLILLSLMIDGIWLYSFCLLVLLFFILIPLSVWMFDLRFHASVHKQARLSHITKLINGILLIKSQAWELPIVRKIEELWRKEYFLVKRHFCGMSLLQTIANNSALLLWTPVLFLYLSSSHSVKVISIFPVLGILLTIGRSSLSHFFSALRSLSDFVSIVLKVQEFLLLQDSVEKEKQTEGPRVVAQDLSVTWKKIATQQRVNQGKANKKADEEINLLDKGQSELSPPIIQNLSFELNEGDHLGIIGETGSGKSSLFASIIGQTEILKGILCVNGSIAYAAQTPLIISDSIRNNIMFGRTMDEPRLREVIKLCELRDFVKELPHGILTKLGKGGIKVSDSIKARISLARAIYSNQDIYLIDSTFDQIEIQTAMKVFQKCIRGYLRNKTVIIITGQHQFLQTVGKILLLKPRAKGVVYQNYTHLERSPDFAFLGDILKKSRQSTEQEEKVEEFTSRYRVSIISSISDVQERRMTVKGPPQEASSEGSVQEIRNSYSTYFDVKGKCCSVSVIGISLFPMALQTLLRFWICFKNPQQQLSTSAIIELIGFILVWVLFSIVSRCLLYNLTSQATSRFHSRAVDHLAHFPLSYFNNASVSRILRIFETDLAVLQFTHPLYFSLLVNTFWVLVSQIFVSLFAFPYLILSFFLLVILLLLLLKATMPIITRSLYYQEKSRSSLESCLADTYQGLLTIKAYKHQDHFLSYYLSQVNSNARAILTYNAFSSFLGFYTNLLSSLYAFSFLGFLLFFPEIQKNTMLVSLGLTSAVLLGEWLHSFTHYLGCVLSQLQKVNRVMRFGELPVQPGRQYSFFAGEWPSKGHIYFHNVEVLNEQNNQHILKSISFEAPPGSKIGIIGDREAGISSLLQTLLRIKISQPGSVIAIDGVNIAEIDLQTLRSSISIIPQSPILMDASIRQNIDPYFDFTDMQIWNALRSIGLNAKISRFPNQLNEHASVVSSQLSPLEQQFLFLVRAILRNNRILVIDEPSGGNSRTLLKEVHKLHRENKPTMLIFGQTIESIIEADSVLVLSNGEALQFAHPYNLLQESEGLFANMVNALEPQRAYALREKAHSSYFKSQKVTAS